MTVRRGAGDAPLRVLWRSAFAAPDANLLPPGCRLHVEPDLDRALALRDEEAVTTTLPAHRPFWTLPNVVLSPHRADASDDTDRARHEDVAATLRAILEGRERSRVDVAVGY